MVANAVRRMFCRNVHVLREKHRLSEQDMAHIMGISVEGLKALEKGRIPEEFQMDMVFHLAEHFQLVPRDLLMPQ